jgi:magnesium chelatase family protein
VPGSSLGGYEFVAELALGGDLRPVPGILPCALGTVRDRRKLVCAQDNGSEAALCSAADILPAAHLLDACRQLHDPSRLSPACPPAQLFSTTEHDLADVCGQQQARRALEVAAAGSHHLLLIGPPGTGKTLLASRLPGILPELSDDEALETAAVASTGPQGFDPRRWKQKPFRAPHHTASAAALVGGGSHPQPGEISLAHLGVLFLDELPEFRRHVLEALREPLETGRVTISRATRQTDFPARFQLIAAMNPCKCGLAGTPGHTCKRGDACAADYQSRISGPFLDRIDIRVDVPAVTAADMIGPATAESSASVAARVGAARSIQRERYLKAGRPDVFTNAHASAALIEAVVDPDTESRTLLLQAAERFKLSARAYHRVLKVARTLADLGGSDKVTRPHIAEALSYRISLAGT